MLFENLIKDMSQFIKTSDSYVDTIYNDLITSIELRLRNLKINHRQYATALKISEGRISQIFSTTQNLTLSKLYDLLAPLKLGFTIVLHESETPIKSSCFNRIREYPKQEYGSGI